DLAWLQLGDGEGASAPIEVRVVQELDSDRSVVRPGRLIGPLGEVDPNGRMARVLVAVDDPLGRLAPEDAPAVPLLIGEYVRVEIVGAAIPDLVAIPRSALREGSCVWVMDRDSRLGIRPVRRVFSDAEQVYVENGFREGDRIVTSSLQVAVPGLPLTATLVSAGAREESVDGR
ncbi:MAG: hypothetical protein KDC38_17945, partial [Planctomycetes bacterium]|nr:hypothetical protein [Planctomycetota bacterium]